ncbi:DUF1674 domain-containing protein [Methylomonas sp. 2BW1-5-20]|uniref:DUF1674 domain-containing protein n=1 Tax=Methylomonas sp. 2BW1-5-20 TaxID=3376686 RepID=UPI00404FF6B2
MNSDQTTQQESLEGALPKTDKILPDEKSAAVPEEINGPKGPEPTRFGDWERKGRCVDF